MITEALWQELQLLQKQAGQEDSSAALMLADWPKQEDYPQDEEAASQTDLMRQITAAINQMRSQQPGLTDKTQLPQLLLTGSSDARLQGVKKDLDALQKFLRVDEIHASVDLEQPALSAASVVEDIRVYVPLAGLIDVDAEIERLKKLLVTSEKNVAKLEGQLNNEGFVSRAPAEVVEQSRERLANEKETITVVQEQLAQLSKHAS